MFGRGRGKRQKVSKKGKELLTGEERTRLLFYQQGRCGICGRPEGHRALCVDHSHATGAVRGLLCTWCNYTLGILRDNETWLAGALRYLQAPPWGTLQQQQSSPLVDKEYHE